MKMPKHKPERFLSFIYNMLTTSSYPEIPHQRFNLDEFDKLIKFYFIKIGIFNELCITFDEKTTFTISCYMLSKTPNVNEFYCGVCQVHQADFERYISVNIDSKEKEYAIINKIQEFIIEKL